MPLKLAEVWRKLTCATVERVSEPTMKLDRKRQLSLLKMLAEIYPERGDFHQADGETEEDERADAANLYYLEEHGLVQVRWRGNMNVGSAAVGNAKITASGMDFLADDGGLTAILGVVTVKLHDDTIRQLLIAKVDESDASETVKAKLKDQIAALPAEGLKEAATQLMQAGISNMPNILSFLANLVG